MLKKACSIVGICVLFFLILEGLCSGLFVAYRLWTPFEHRTLSGHSVKYDPELCWTTVPNFFDKDYYAPDTYLRINSQGFRADHDFTKQAPQGKIRVICSGDSQTFGDGVSNNHTWCQDLEALDGRFEAVNMAESGYGADQMYLRYKREGAVLDHDIHVFAFVTADFLRMNFTVLGGYGKPVLKLKNGELVVENVPVPPRSALLHWLALKPHPLRQFRSLALMADLADRLVPRRDTDFSKGPNTKEAEILDKMFEDLVSIESQKNSIVVLLWIPERETDYKPGGPTPAWEQWIRAQCEKRGMVLVDLIDSFKKLPVTRKDGLYIWPGSLQYFAETPGHFDDQGHEWVARALYARLISITQVAQKLAIPGGGSQVAQHRFDPTAASAESR
jgi:hypothetical protein